MRHRRIGEDRAAKASHWARRLGAGIGLVGTLGFTQERNGSGESIGPVANTRKPGPPVAEATVVVTASRFEQPLEKAPGAVTVVQAGELQALAPKFTNDAIALVPGIQVRRAKGMMDISRTFSIRGFGSANRVLVLVDGQRREDWDRIPVSLVERIEVVRGPQSAMYGDAAMGGVVNVITRSPQGMMAEASVGIETYGTTAANLTCGDRTGSFDWSVSATRRHTDGYVSDRVVVTPSSSTAGATQVHGLESLGNRRSWDDRTGQWVSKEAFLAGTSGRNDMTDHHVGFAIGWTSPAESRFQIQGYAKGYRYGYTSGSSLVRDLNGNVIRPALGNNALVQQPDGRRFSLSGASYEGTYGGEPGRGVNVSYDHNLGAETLLSVKTGGSFADHWFGDPSNTSSSTRERRVWGEIQTVTGYSGGQRLTAGIAWKRDRVDCDKWHLADWKAIHSKTTLNFAMEGEVSTASAFLQHARPVTERFEITLGARLDAWKTPSGESTFWNSGRSLYITSTYAGRSRNAVSPKLAGVWRISEATVVRASAGNGFRGPTGTDLYKDWDSSGKLYLGNAGLKPERTQSWEMGVDQTLWRGAKANVTGFDNIAKDFIYRRTLSASEIAEYNAAHGTGYGANAIVRFDNIGTARLRGFEASFTQEVGKLRCSSAWTRTLSRVERQDANPRSVGKHLPGTPPNVWNVSLDWRQAISNGDTLQVSGQTQWMDKTFSTDDNADIENGPQRYEAYAVTGVRLAWEHPTAAKHVWRLTASVENAFDRTYYQYYQAPGRIVGLHLSYRY